MSDAALTILVPKAILIQFLYTNGLRFWFLLSIAVCWGQSEESSFQRGVALYRSADCRAAVPLLEQSAATNPRAALLAGRCYFESQQWAKAADAFAAYQKSTPGDPEGLILLARARERAGQGDAAAVLLNDYLKVNPGA